MGYTEGRFVVQQTLPFASVQRQSRQRVSEMPVGSRIQVCKVGDVAPGEVIKVETSGLTLAVYNLDGVFYATDDACTHGPGSLSEGCIEGDLIECNFHQGMFNIKTGEVALPPCMVPIKTYPVTVDGDEVFIEA